MPGNKIWVRRKLKTLAQTRRPMGLEVLRRMKSYESLSRRRQRFSSRIFHCNFECPSECRDVIEIDLPAQVKSLDRPTSPAEIVCEHGSPGGRRPNKKA